MKSNIFISSLTNYDKTQEIIDHCWTGKYNFDELKLTPPPKVSSVIEILEETRRSAISFHCEYLVISRQHNHCSTLFLINLKDKRIFYLKKFESFCCHLSFLSDHENILIVGLENNSLFEYNLETETWTKVEEHSSSILGVQLFNQSLTKHLLSWSSSEALIWLWPSYTLVKRLIVDSQAEIVLSGHLQERNQIFAAFENGTVILWNLDRLNAKKSVIVTPDNIDMKFQTFAVSKDGNWLVGGGTDTMYVTYSLVGQRVSQVVSVARHECVSHIEYMQFLPPVCPTYAKCVLISSPSCIIVSDFENCSTVKILRSQHYDIEHVSLSGDGMLICVTYSNGCSKIYTLASFFPPVEEQLDLEIPEVKLKVLKSDEHIQEKSLSKSNVEKLLEPSKWLKIVDEFGCFPAKYRQHIWSSLLKLPRNFSIFSNLLSKDQHNWSPPLSIIYQEASSNLVDVLESTLSCLHHWCPLLNCIDILPSLIFPFVNLFEDNAMLSFEISLVLILNWFVPWLEAFPCSPPEVVSAVDDLIRDQDPSLWVHLTNLSLSPDFALQSLFSTSMAKVLSSEEWASLWDQMFSKSCSFYVSVLTAFILVRKEALLNCSTFHQAKELFVKPSFILAKDIVKKAKFVHPNLDETLKKKFDRRTHIPNGDLPPLNFHLNRKFLRSGLQKSSFHLGPSDCPGYSRHNQETASMDILHQDERPRSDLQSKGNQCMRRINQLRRKQTVRFNI